MTEEKNYSLTWEDMKLILDLHSQMVNDVKWAIRLLEEPERGYCEELLRRYNTVKESCTE